MEEAPTALEDTPPVMDVDATDVEDPPMALLPGALLVARDAAEDPRELVDALLPLITALLVPVKEKEDPDVDTVEAAPDAADDAPLPAHDGTQRL